MYYIGSNFNACCAVLPIHVFVRASDRECVCGCVCGCAVENIAYLGARVKIV